MILCVCVCGQNQSPECVCVSLSVCTWVAHRRVQQVHGSSAQPQAVDAIWGLFEVGHHATGGHGSTQLQLRPRVRFPPVLQLGDGAGVSKLLQVWRKEMWSDTEKKKKKN